MKWLPLLLLFILASSLVLGEYEDLLGNNEAYLVDEGVLYFKKPAFAYEGSLFDILLYPDVNVTNLENDLELDMVIYKEGKILEKSPSTVDFNGETVVIWSWSDIISEDTNYKLSYEKNGRETFEESFIVKVKQKVVVDRILQESIYLPKKVTDNQRENLIGLMNEQDYDFSLEQFIKEENQGKELISLDKKVFVETLIYNDNSTSIQTVVVIDLKTDEILSDVKIIETIPKDFASNVSEIIHDKDFIVLEEDPIIMWHLENMDDTRIQYAVNGNATLTGNTVLLTSVAIEEEIEMVETSKKNFLPIILIIIVAAIIIFFSRFTQKPAKKKRRRY